MSDAWLNLTEKYKILETIGKGSFGEVVKGRCRLTGQTVAIKCINDFDYSEYHCV